MTETPDAGALAGPKRGPKRGPGYAATVAALAVGQILNWAALYYAFSSFVLPMQASLGWGKPMLMGAYTGGLAVWGAATYAVGAAIDAGHGRAVMTTGSLLAGLGIAAKAWWPARSAMTRRPMPPCTRPCAGPASGC